MAGPCTPGPGGSTVAGPCTPGPGGPRRQARLVKREGLVRSLHFITLGHDMTKGPGLWGAGPALAGNEGTGQQAYEDPPAEDVPRLMDELIERLRSVDSRPPVVRGDGSPQLRDGAPVPREVSLSD